MDLTDHRRKLIAILQNAYSGELGAAYAYRGHWKSVKNRSERQKILEIENDEWIHRKEVGLMLEQLGSRPLRFKEIFLWIVGRLLGIFCRPAGWFFPMYFAGRLETQNVQEYETAALHARALGLNDFNEMLKKMARTEKKHEEFFMKAVADHRLFPLMRKIFKPSPSLSK